MAATLDTPLARHLHTRGLVGLAPLQRALEELDDRSDAAALAARLVARGHLSSVDAEAALRELGQPAPGSRPGASLAAGALVGDHRVVRRLGSGGMGTIFEVVHEPTGATRALKLLHAGADAALRLRFAREAELLARVDGHPNVVRVHACFEALGGVVLVMELAPGGSLLDRLAKGPLPPVELVRLGLALARGLSHLHRHGVLHRDLKPHNVVFGEGGAPLLVDFGLASAAGNLSLTATGEVLGTPAYMAPEQATGDRAALGPATDVYGLGALLFHAATGQPPFTGRSALDVLAQVCTVPAPRVASIVPGFPAALDAALARALAKSPAERPRSAEAFAASLEAAPPEPASRRGVALVAALGVVAVAAAIAWGRPAARTLAPPTSDTASTATTGPTPDTATTTSLALVDALLAREEDGQALAALEEVWPAVDPAALAPRVFAALVVSRDLAAAERWGARGGPVAEAAQVASAFGGVADLGATAWAGLDAAPILTAHEALVALEATNDQARRDDWQGKAFDSVEAPLLRAVTLAESASLDPVGRGLRVRTQQEVVERDFALVSAQTLVSRAGPEERRRVEKLVESARRLVERARRLAPTSRAAAALEVSQALVVMRDADRQGATVPWRVPPVDPARLAGRFELQQVVLLGMRVLAFGRSEEAVRAGLVDWDALEAGAIRLGFLTAEGKAGTRVEVPLERAQYTDVVVRAGEVRPLLLVWCAWHERADPVAAAARRAEALRAAEELKRVRKALGGERAVTAHLLAGDAAEARRAFGGPGTDDGLPNWLRGCLEVDLLLLEGETAQARELLTKLAPRSSNKHVTAQLALWAAAVEAEAGGFEAAEAHLARAEQTLAVPRESLAAEQMVQVPWRTPAATARLIERSRGGWRVKTAGRLYPDLVR